jgi:hypothetical protein
MREIAFGMRETPFGLRVGMRCAGVDPLCAAHIKYLVFSKELCRQTAFGLRVGLRLPIWRSTPTTDN